MILSDVILEVSKYAFC